MNGDARWINGWFFKASISYPRFLQTKQFERSIKLSISEQTSKLVASAQDLAQQNIEAINEGNQLLVQVSADLSARLDEVNATLHWGFTEVLAGLGHINDHLADLVRVARTPSQTWAYEQYDIARDAYRRGLYAESLRYVKRAIEGVPGSAGYDLDFRFYYLKGLLHLGSYDNSDPALVDPPSAESSFVLAARYAGQDHQMDAARALLLAARAAYCNRDLDHARRHADSAITLFPAPIAEAHFHRAKILFALDTDIPDALNDLRIAIEIDRMYAIEIDSDGDIAPHASAVRTMIASLCTALSQSIEDQEGTLGLRLARFRRTTIGPSSFEAVDRAGIEAIDKELSLVQASRHAGTLFGLLDARTRLIAASAFLDQMWRRFRTAAREELNRRRERCKTLSFVGLVKNHALAGAILGYIFGAISTESAEAFLYALWGLGAVPAIGVPFALAWRFRMSRQIADDEARLADAERIA